MGVILDSQDKVLGEGHFSEDIKMNEVLTESKQENALEDIEKSPLQLRLEYIQGVMIRLRETVQPVSRPITIGGKEVPSSYDENMDIDYLKYKFFFQAVSFDKEICEIILNPKSQDIKREVLSMNLADLIISAKTKELFIMRELNDLNQQKTV